MQTKLVVIEEKKLGYILPGDTQRAHILSAPITKGNAGSLDPVYLHGLSYRLANEKDFDDFGVSFEDYKSDSENYEFAE